MTPVLCESFNNNNNSVGVCGKMGDYPEYQEFQKQSNVAHYPDQHHTDPTYTYTEVKCSHTTPTFFMIHIFSACQR